MKKLLLLAVATPLLLFTACKSKEEKKNESETTTTTDNAAKVTGSITETGETKNANWERRKAKGDTVAMPYKDLQAYLPDVSGYTREGGAKGSQMNIPGAGSWSQAEQEYKNGEKEATVSIFDYNSAYQTFEGLTAVYKMGFSSEDDNRKQASVDIGVKNVGDYETIDKQNKQTERIIAGAETFFLKH